MLLDLYDSSDVKARGLDDPLSAGLTVEVNGEETLSFSLPQGHSARTYVQPERLVGYDLQLYRIRSIVTSRSSGVPIVEVMCQARWYDLRYAGQIDAQDWSAVTPATVMATILADTDWSVGTVDVTTTRTWSMTEADPLTCLRQLQSNHGGDLTFDCYARTVSLHTFAGQRNGLTLTYDGGGLTSAKRSIDTTSMCTRIYARNADGLTIADVNGGLPYLEDYTYTTEVRVGVYDFVAGVSAYQMLSLTRAALGKRAKPSVVYECEVIDLHATSGQALDLIGVGDEIRVVDAELDIDTTERVVKLEYDLLRPERTQITLSETLRELGSSDSTDQGVLTTGVDIDTRDLVPFNLLRNARFDNGLAHWAASGASVVAEGKTGPNAVEIPADTNGWIEQTVAPDNRGDYMLSLDVEGEGYAAGVAPEVTVEVEVTYDDGTTETITRTLT